MADDPNTSAPQVKPVSIWRSDVRPWWAPDAQGFMIFSVTVIAAISLFYRMTHPSEVNDKLLDMMLTLLFGTALVSIVNYLFGSSRGSASKDEAINKIAMMPTTPPPNDK